MNMGDTKVTTEPLKPSPDMPPPAHPGALPERMDANLAEGSEDQEEELEKKQTNKSDIPEPEYPSFAKVIPIMASIYMTFFLIALVSSTSLSTFSTQ